MYGDVPPDQLPTKLMVCPTYELEELGEREIEVIVYVWVKLNILFVLEWSSDVILL